MKEKNYGSQDIWYKKLLFPILWKWHRYKISLKVTWLFRIKQWKMQLINFWVYFYYGKILHCRINKYKENNVLIYDIWHYMMPRIKRLDIHLHPCMDAI